MGDSMRAPSFSGDDLPVPAHLGVEQVAASSLGEGPVGLGGLQVLQGLGLQVREDVPSVAGLEGRVEGRGGGDGGQAEHGHDLDGMHI